MPSEDNVRTVAKLLRQQAALAEFGSFSFREPNLNTILTEAARICASSLDVPFSKICRYRAVENDLLIEAGWGWKLGVIGRVVSKADESSPQGRAFITGKPVIIRNINTANNLSLPAFYADHAVVSTVDVLIPAIDGAPYGVLEIDSSQQQHYDEHDINFLTGFANVLAEAVATTTRTRALRDALAAKDLMAEELQHRVRNNLQIIGGMLESYARSAGTGELRDGIQSIVHRVTTLAQVYDSLLGVGLSERVDLGTYLCSLCKTLPTLQPDRIHPVTINCHADAVLMSLDSVASLGIVLAELVTNSYDHAFPERAGTITVTLEHNGPTRATLVVSDNGIGHMSPAGSARRGVGLVQRLVEIVGGTYRIRRDAGTEWTVTLPLHPERIAA